MSNTFTIGRHGSFQLRYGWITKGIQAIQAKKAHKISDVFTSDDATVNLGVGKNMVAAIRYWLTATKVIDNGSITEFGEFLNQKDIYLEDDASLWLLHLALVQNKELATSVYWLFNHFHQNEFSAEEAGNAFLSYASENNWKGSEKTLKMDIQVILRMYAPHKSKKTQIEDMLESPLSLLGLIQYFDGKYHFSFGSKNIPIEVVTHNINERFRNDKTVSVQNLMYGDNAFAPALKIREDELIAILEKITQKYNDYHLREDAGVFQLHKSITTDTYEYLKKYYAT
ncbi:DUF4007 family protein [bacterium endosymbiont of Bathymodiolus sp. 5 South]|jgi:hypothetical protein|uniref:DUF4007 family protein n=1 Tax=bacterium endosymbiont of Bathymodiolus sp. 5 South TaxID=1181670 RepID=UPI0010B65FAE|nr:DUF4007 family protein [bacterium endosymbiont of Bathymodiolus sp. 5 South]VVH57963.1 hypothetical protein BSPCLSOX_100 [uncultured Gammaproteobacteria bacterium]SHN91304.1 hypothetical protein BCLUESOX_1624 [bacterium endosymbiont of Bathymodiolus sp. 5 South]SSC07085.1 hypothetical protein BTURTLESOX_2301 [bacterium endosymbiont of Bathymodiolus sp. 5 South]VVH61519.1 hypothetical protein BSPWISOX_1869 [uncultured Gammaproteobacteria bacterium]VVM25089.1 hypothetical protein BSPWISOXPB_3